MGVPSQINQKIDMYNTQSGRGHLMTSAASPHKTCVKILSESFSTLETLRTLLSCQIKKIDGGSLVFTKNRFQRTSKSSKYRLILKTMAPILNNTESDTLLQKTCQEPTSAFHIDLYYIINNLILSPMQIL